MTERMTLFLIALAVAVLFLPLGMRLFTQDAGLQTFPVGSQPYVHLLITERLALPDDEVLAGLFSERVIPPHPFHRLLAFLSRGNPLLLKAGIIIIPLMCGILSLFLFSYLLHLFGVSDLTRHMALLALILSPSFLYTFLVAAPDAFAILILLIGAAGLVSSSRILSILGIMFLLFGATISLFHALLILFFLLFYALRVIPLRKKMLTTLALFAVLVIILVLQRPFTLPYTLFSLSLNSFLADFGGVSGLSLFYLLLFCTGLVIAWREKKEYAPLYLALALLVPALFWYPHLLVYSTFIGAVFAGRALSYFKEMAWHFRSVGRVTLFVIILGLLFSSLSYANRLQRFPPTDDQISGLAFLDEYAQPDSIVLSVPAMGYLIEYFVQRPALLDEALPVPLFQRRLQDAQTIFHSRNPDITKALLIKHQITFIVITDDMKKGGVWEGQDDGLLFVLRDSETFKNIYAAPSLEIWEVIP